VPRNCRADSNGIYLYLRTRNGSNMTKKASYFRWMGLHMSPHGLTQQFTRSCVNYSSVTFCLNVIYKSFLIFDQVLKN
jgi:hypothetical protein